MTEIVINFSQFICQNVSVTILSTKHVVKLNEN